MSGSPVILRRGMFPRSSPYAQIVHRRAAVLLIQSTPPFTVCARSAYEVSDRAPDSGGTSGGAGGDVVDSGSALYPTAVRAPSLVVLSCVDRAQAGGASHPEYSALHRLCPVHRQGKGQVATWLVLVLANILRRCLSAAIRGGR